MAALWMYRDPIDRLHQQALQRDKSSRFFKPTPRSQRQALTRRAVAAIIMAVEPWGYRTNETAHKCPFDIWIEGVKVEIKASTYGPHPRSSGRYQAHIKNTEADLVIFDCINGTDHFHIIPMIDIGSRKNISVWSYDPADSTGQWLPYLEAWDFLHEAVQTSRHIWQPPLF